MVRNTCLSIDDLLLAPGGMFACLLGSIGCSCEALSEDLMEGSGAILGGKEAPFLDPQFQTKAELIALSTLLPESVGPSIRGMN